MGIVGRLDQYASMLAGEFDDYSMSENLFLYSEQFDNAYWTKQNANITSNATTAPNGTLTADVLIENTTPSVGHQIARDITYVTGKSYTISWYFKIYPGPITRYARLRIGLADAFGIDTFININISTGAILGTSGTPDSTSVINVGNGWYRASISKQYTGGGVTTLSLPLVQIINTSEIALYTDPDGLSGIYIWGAQWEESSSATDYTPTTTAAKTRVLPSTTNTSITGLGTYYSSGFSENIGAATTLVANVFPPYDLVYDDFGGTLFGVGQGRYMRQNTDKSVIVYNEIDEVSDFRDIVRTGLVLDLDAAQPLSYKGTGTAWNDLSGNSNTGTLVNTPTYSTSGYFDFDYTQSENVTFSNTSSLQFLNRLPYTLEAWVYPTQNPGAGNFTGIFDRESTFSGSRDGYNLFFLGSATTDTFFITERFITGTNNSTSVTLNQSVSVNSWQHIIATYDGTTLSLYRNGSSVGTPATTTGNISNTSKSLTIAVRGNQYFRGRIANTKIYNRALTATEITQNYNALKHRFDL